MKNKLTFLFLLCTALFFFRCQSIAFISLGSPSHHDEGRRMILDQDGHFLVAGQLADKAVLYKLDCKGTVLDTFLYEAEGSTTGIFVDLLQLPNAQLLAAGHFSMNGQIHSILLRLGPDFSTLATTRFRLSDRDTRVRRLLPLNDTEVALFGVMAGDGFDFSNTFYQKANLSTLAMAGQTHIYSYGVDELGDAIKVSDSVMVICGGSTVGNIFTGDSLINRAWVAAIDTSGALNWRYQLQQEFPGRFGRATFGALSTVSNSGKVLAAGLIFSGDTVSRLADPFYAWLDEQGVVLDTVSFPFAGRQQIFTATPALAGGFLAAGHTTGTENTTGNARTFVNYVEVNNDTLLVSRPNNFEDKFQTVYHLGRKPNGLVYGVGTSRTAAFGQLDLEVALPRPFVSLEADGDTLKTNYFTNELDFQWYYEGKLLPVEDKNWIMPQQEGNYTLTVSDPDGCAESDAFYWGISDTIKVASLFRAIRNPVCIDNDILLRNIVNDAASYHWDFGDGRTASTQNPGIVRYPDTALYPITLTIETFPGQQMINEIVFLDIPNFCCDPIFDPVPAPYVRIRDENFNLLYTSPNGGEPISKIPTAILLSPNQIYTLEVWEFDLLSNDDFMGSFTIQGNTTHTVYQQGSLHIEINIEPAAPFYTYTDTIQVTRPVIIADGDSLIVDLPYFEISAATTFQWYLEGQAISGATAAAYKPQQSGEYTVKINQASCLNTFSEPYLWNITATEKLSTRTVERIKVFPNPQQVGKNIRISIQHDATEDAQIILLDPSGRVLHMTSVSLREGENEISQQLPATPGLYLVRLVGESGRQYSGKVVVE